MTQADLNRLKRDTNSAIAKIKADKNRPKEAVNWADLRCVDVRPWTPESDGFLAVTVYIEEADPGCWNFKSQVAELLRKKWGAVEVNCEW